MFSPLRNRFGIPGVISVIALVFAMLGGAYAANNSSGGGKATASAKAKKGPRGPKGATGPAGPAGAQGPAGANGKDGANGANGSNGASGTNGKSVVTATLNPGQGGCAEGGASVEVSGESATKKSVCNGEEGPAGNAGTPGSPWVVGTAPTGALLKGVWTLPPGYTAAAAGEVIPVSVSSVVPLNGAVLAHLVAAGPAANPSEPFGCTGTATAPVAPPPPGPGITLLCIYQGQVDATNVEANVNSGDNATASGAGVNVLFQSAGPGPVAGRGVWAMQAP